MSEEESIWDPFYFFHAFHFSLPAALLSTHSFFQQCSSHPPHSLATADTELTQSFVVHQERCKSAKPQGEKFSAFISCPSRYIASCVWGMWVSLGIFWQIFQKASARLPAPSLAKIRVALTPQGMLWIQMSLSDAAAPPAQWPCQAPLQNNFKGPPQSYILPSDKTRPKMKVPLLPGMPSSTLKPSQKKREREQVFRGTKIPALSFLQNQELFIKMKPPKKLCAVIALT